MPDPSTTRLALYKSKSDGSELVSYAQDIGQNWDKVDAAVGALACTSSTRPSAPWNGQLIRETDTNRAWVSNGSAPASGSWREIATPGTLQTFTAGIALTNASATGITIATAVTGDAQRRFGIQADGKLRWGTGAATEDTFLYRTGINALTTDGKLTVAGDLVVGGVGQRTFLRKTADTGRTATVGADDPHITGSVVAGTYEVEGVLSVLGSDTVGDLVVTFTVPGSTAGNWYGIGQPAAGTSDLGTVRTTVSPFDGSSSKTFGAMTSGQGGPTSIFISGLLRPTTSGTFALNWARAGASGTVTVQTDSYLRLSRVG